MPKVITLQPSARTDHITEDGHELQQLPYPFHVTEEGDIERQDFWRGRPKGVIGFQKDLAVMTIDLLWSDAVKDPQKAVGMYVVTVDDDGGWAVHLSAISDVHVREVAA